NIYYHANGDVLKAFSIANARLSTSPTSSSSNHYAYPGATPSVSSNGNTNGIFWEMDPSAGSATLHAYGATNIATELYNSNMAGPRDALGPGVKFTPPIIADGEVFAPTGNALAIFGLLAPPTLPPAAPSNLSATAGGSSYVRLAWQDNSTNEGGFKVERSSDGINFA